MKQENNIKNKIKKYTIKDRSENRIIKDIKAYECRRHINNTKTIKTLKILLISVIAVIAILVIINICEAIIYQSPRNMTLLLIIEVYDDNECAASIEIIPTKRNYENESIEFTNRLGGINTSSKYIIEYSLENSEGKTVYIKKTTNNRQKSFYIQKQENEIETYKIKSTLLMLDCENTNQNNESSAEIILKLKQEPAINESSTIQGTNGEIPQEMDIWRQEAEDLKERSQKQIKAERAFEIESFYTLTKRPAEKINIYTTIKNKANNPLPLNLLLYTNIECEEKTIILSQKSSTKINFTINTQKGNNRAIIKAKDPINNSSQTKELQITMTDNKISAEQIINTRESTDFETKCANETKDKINRTEENKTTRTYNDFKRTEISLQEPKTQNNISYNINKKGKDLNNKENNKNSLNLENNINTGTNSNNIAISLTENRRYQDNNTNNISQTTIKDQNQTKTMTIYESAGTKSKKIAYYFILLIFACIALLGTIILKKEN